MTPKKFYQTKPKEEVKRVAKEAKTTLDNFKQIALFNGSVSPKLAARLAESSGEEMTELEILYPDRFKDSAA